MLPPLKRVGCHVARSARSSRTNVLLQGPRQALCRPDNNEVVVLLTCMLFRPLCSRAIPDSDVLRHPLLSKYLRRASGQTCTLTCLRSICSIILSPFYTSTYLKHKLYPICNNDSTRRELFGERGYVVTQRELRVRRISTSQLN